MDRESVAYLLQSSAIYADYVPIFAETFV